MEPAPPPAEPHDPDGWLTNDKGVTIHKDRIHYKVIVKCTWCGTQYRTQWGEGNGPYEELKEKQWLSGKDKSGKYIWQQARCPRYYKGCTPSL